MQKREEKEIKLPSKFQGLFKPARYKIYFGGRGGSKSWTIATALIARAYSEPLRILCTREFQSSIADSVHRLLSDRIHDLSLEVRIINESVIKIKTIIDNDLEL